MERANWTGNALHYGEAQRRRDTVASAYAPNALLVPCHGCIGGWHRFDNYALCDQCHGASLVPAPAPIIQLDAARVGTLGKVA